MMFLLIIGMGLLGLASVVGLVVLWLTRKQGDEGRNER